MKRLLATLLDGLRAAFLRHPRGTVLTASAGVYVALVAVYLAVSFGMELVDTPPPWRLDPAGISTVLADSLLTLVATWLLATLAQRRDIVWGAAAILLAATIATAAVIHWPLAYTASALLQHDHAVLALLLELVSRAWWFLVLLVFAHWLAPRGLARALAGALLAYAISAAAWWWLPAAPLLESAPASDEVAEDTNAADTTEPDADANPAAHEDDEAAQPGFDAEEVMFNQRTLLDASLAKLKPRMPGKTNLYAIAFAGDADQDVFRNEAEYAERLFAQRFDADGYVLVLENNAATVATRPLATWTNLHHALDAIAKKMDPAQDILLVYLTTHGSEDHQLLVDLDPLPLDQIEPVDLADALKTEPGIRWKVLVVNACYSGGFVDALRDDSTMVITSARADRTSFGCGADSDITWFGKAFLVEALNKTTSLREAFDLAKRAVGSWEAAGKNEPSEPQIASSHSIEAKLADWRKQLPAQPAVPFTPAAASTTAR
ncbi:C13 family peptidase [Dokdonella soli]|uniref:Peptidase C13 n=1 Tax=Dokdonella soli TaxID=529810 RepID=A0ABP3TPJ3_9GAMM